MTLIITELSRLGIAMVADSAVTSITTLPSGRVFTQILNGVRKLHFIPRIKAGLSVWGRGTIPIGHDEISTDVWIMDFIERNAGLSSIDEYAKKLSLECQKALKGQREPGRDELGFHLAGYVQVEGETLPTFYHVRNVDGPFNHLEFHDFIPGQDFVPRHLGINEAYLTRNGDFGPYAMLASATQNTLPLIKAATGLTIPYPSLERRLDYHRVWVTFISDLYASSNLERTIGGTVSALGIYPDGSTILSP